MNKFAKDMIKIYKINNQSNIFNNNNKELKTPKF